MSRWPRAAREAADHARARELAARRMDEILPAPEDVWLDVHLGRCDACRAIAAAYESQRSAFRMLRAEQIEPPRDLWARTSAAMDNSRRRSGPRTRLAGSVSLAPVAGLLVVAIVVGAGLLNSDTAQPPIGGTDSGQPENATPIAVQAGQLQVISRAPNGRVEIRSGEVDEVCPVGADTCGLTTAFDVTQSTSLAGGSALDAIISPSRDRLVVVGRGDGPQSIYVLPVTTSVTAPGSGATAKPSLQTDAPTTHPGKSPGTPTPTDRVSTPGPAATATGSAPVSEPPEASPSEQEASPTPIDTAVTASPSDTPGPTSSGAATPTDRPTPSDRPDSESPSPKPDASDATATPSPTVEVTPGPDGAIEIARDVTIVGSVAAYAPDGRRFAFSARPAGGSAGPDVYVWQIGESTASAVTTDHGSVFAGWLGGSILASRVVGGTPVTVLVSPTGGPEARIGVDPMWLPTVAPGAAVAVWWDGTVQRASDGRTWIPDTGSLILAPWPNDGGDVQVLASGPLADWEVRWDSTGSVLAIWLLPAAGSSSVGRLSLYPIDPDTGMPDLTMPRLADAPAYAGFSLHDGRLAWSAPDGNGGSSVQVLAWNGTTVGRLALPDSDGATVVR